MFSENKQKKSSKKPLRSKLLLEYLEFLRTYQGVSEATIAIRRHYVSPFLIELGKQAAPSKIGSISPYIIHDYIIKTANPMHRASRKHLSSSLRSFFRFIYLKGYTSRNLVSAVPVIITWKLDRLPRAISWENVQKLLKAPNRFKSSGRRDYAILQLIVTYGVRIGQVTQLKLRDIDWHGGLIHFKQCKKGKALTFPLKPKVINALLAYLRKDRGNATFPEVFLTVNRPIKPFSSNYRLGTSLMRYYKRAGIHSKVQGTHPIRHAFATRLMEQKVPIKTISDLLGHRSINTTFIYTKVDIPQLCLLIREWPKEVTL